MRGRGICIRSWSKFLLSLCFCEMFFILGEEMFMEYFHGFGKHRHKP